MKRRVRRTLAALLWSGAAAGMVAAAAIVPASGCKGDNENLKPCLATYPACTVSDAGPPADGPPLIPFAECVAAAAREILTTELKIAMLGQKSADPNVKAAADLMAADFTAALADLDAVEARQTIVEVMDCDEKKQAVALVEPTLMTLQNLTGPAFDQQFASVAGMALADVLTFYNFKLIGNVNSGDFKTSLRFERLRSVDSGAPVAKFPSGTTSCPPPTCLGIAAERAALNALAGGGGAPDSGSGSEAGSGSDGGTGPDGGSSSGSDGATDGGAAEGAADAGSGG
jgi:hypothetical protein